MAPPCATPSPRSIKKPKNSSNYSNQIANYLYSKIRMKSLKWLLEIIYYEVNHKSEKSHDPMPIIGFFITAIIAFVIPIFDALLGHDLMYIIVMLLVTPIMCLSVFLYFRFHHNDIMSNEDYINADNRKKIYNVTCAICIFGCLPLMFLVYFLLKSLNLIV